MKKLMMVLGFIVGIIMMSGCTMCIPGAVGLLMHEGSQILWYNPSKSLEEAIADYRICQCKADDVVHEIVVEQGLSATQPEYQKYVLINRYMELKGYRLRCIFDYDLEKSDGAPVIGNEYVEIK